MYGPRKLAHPVGSRVVVVVPDALVAAYGLPVATLTGEVTERDAEAITVADPAYGEWCLPAAQVRISSYVPIPTSDRWITTTDTGYLVGGEQDDVAWAALVDAGTRFDPVAWAWWLPRGAEFVALGLVRHGYEADEATRTTLERAAAWAAASYCRQSEARPPMRRRARWTVSTSDKGQKSAKVCPKRLDLSA